MLDCPPHNQTSPETTLSNSTLSSASEIFTVYALPAFGGLIFTCHRPSAPAIPAAVFPATSTATFSPGLAQPQIVFNLSRCMTMLLPNIGLTRGKELVLAAAAVHDKSTAPRI